MAVIGLRNLCTPAFVYMFVSLLSIAVMIFQNWVYGEDGLYCLGTYKCNTSSRVIVFLLQIVYVLFWTWLLNLICRSGYNMVAWGLVLIPYLLLFVLIGVYMLS